MIQCRYSTVLSQKISGSLLCNLELRDVPQLIILQHIPPRILRSGTWRDCRIFLRHSDSDHIFSLLRLFLMMLAKEKEKKKGGSSASGGVGWYYRRYPPRIIAASLCHRTQPLSTSSCSGKVVLDSLVLARVPALKRSCVCGSVRVKGPRRVFDHI